MAQLRLLTASDPAPRKHSLSWCNTDSSKLAMMIGVPPVMLLSRQYYQMMDPELLTLPAPRFLRLPEVQRQIYKSMFDDRMQWPPPERYKFRVLKRLVEAMEKAIEDPEEDVGFPYFSLLGLLSLL